ncbi:MAG: tetratricopeptide repeat protein [Phycisphaerae bacterium]|nr:tetratricopeptide repeat protein [Phycisphaerae bacterium]MCZ2400331.1 tetratricopeptide repeat protein [Phycisphaerae bacterium]
MTTAVRARAGSRRGAPGAGRARATPLLVNGRPRYARWRAATLAAVYVLMGLHIAHWKIAGTTLAPLELNEVMYTLELGIVTAGFLFMTAAVLGTAIFGRFFCSWGCHILALEDLCAWLLERAGIRPKPVRSRVLLLVPPAAMFYMFLWPQLRRLWEGRPLPSLHLRTDAEGWASFATNDFWRNLPSIEIALLTFAVCGFLIVYVLGSRAFCTYGCPYGVIFRLADRVAPGRIIAAGDCSQCGACTAACGSQVRVHEELTRYGTIVNPACLKDLDCVAACPNGNVRYGLTRPPLLRSWLRTRVLRRRYDFSMAEEALMAAVFVVSLLALRGLYNAVPFLLTLGLGAILAYLAVLAHRLVTAADVRFNRLQLKRAGRIAPAGAAVLALAAASAMLLAHSGFIRYHEHFGHRAALALERSDVVSADDLRGAIAHLELARRWGLVAPRPLRERLGGLHARLGAMLVDEGQTAAGVAHLRWACALHAGQPRAQYNLGVALASLGNDAEAILALERAAALDPADADAQNNLGFLRGARGELVPASAHLRRALQLAPEHAAAHFNLGRVLLRLGGRQDEAQRLLERAAALDERYAAASRELLAAPEK